MRGLKVKILVVLLGSVLMSSVAFSQYRILHSPPKEVYEGEPIVIEAVVEPAGEGAVRVTLYYRVAGTDSYNEIEMVLADGVYKGTIPGGFVTLAGVEYLIVAEFQDGTIVAFPEVDPYNVPVYLSVLKRAEVPAGNVASKTAAGIESNALILSPERRSIVAPGDLLIAVSLFNVTDLDVSSVKVFLDGIDITSQAEISEEILLCRPRNIRPGLHYVSVRMKNAYGDSFKPLEWSFTLAASEIAAKKILKYSGKIEANAVSEQIRGIRQDIQTIRVISNVEYDWLRFRSKIFVTSLESPDRQPKDRFFAGISTPFVDLNFGDVTPRMTEFGLYGKRVRGFEGNLKLKYFNLHLVMGETERAIRGEIEESIEGDTLLVYTRKGYSYKRNLFAIRPYFGSGKRFQLGFSLIKARDDTLSVDKLVGGVVPAMPYRVEFASGKPQDNLVLGGDLALCFDDRRFVFKTEAAISMWNSDISEGALTKDKLDTFAGDTLDGYFRVGNFEVPLSEIPFDPKDFDFLFIVNENQRPISPIIPDSTGKIGIRQILDMPSTAFKSRLTLNYLNNYVILEYKRVGPNFKSLANPYMRTNVQGFSVSDRVRLFGGRIFLNLLFDQKRDNLNKENRATTTINLFSAGFTIYPGEGLPQINFYTRHNSRFNDLASLDTTFTDSGYIISDYREDNVTITQSLNLTYKISLAGVTNQIMVTYSNSDRVDRIKDRLPGFNFNPMSSRMLRVGFNTTFRFPLRTNVSFATNTNKSGFSEKANKFTTVDARAMYDFYEGKANAYIGYKMMNAGGEVSFVQNNFYLGGYAVVFGKHRMRGQLNYNILNDNVKVYNDLSFNLSYTFTF